MTVIRRPHRVLELTTAEVITRYTAGRLEANMSEPIGNRRG